MTYYLAREKALFIAYYDEEAVESRLGYHTERMCGALDVYDVEHYNVMHFLPLPWMICLFIICPTRIMSPDKNTFSERFAWKM